VTARPVPKMTLETSPFWDRARENALSLPRCLQCERLHFPPLHRCPFCSGQELAWTTLSGRGKLKSWTIVYLPTIPGLAPPRTIGEVELLEQSGLTIALLADIERGALAIDLEVQVAFSHDENGTAYPFARPRGGLETGEAA